MRVVLGAVAKGFTLKEAIKRHLAGSEHEVVDVGAPDTDGFYTYNSVGERVAHALTSGLADLAVNCCGSGTGAAIAVGKFAGICAVSSESVETARLARVVNDANCLCLGESIVDERKACDMVDVFLNSRFQDAPDVPQPVRAFWAEARDEFLARGPEAREREIETKDIS